MTNVLDETRSVQEEQTRSSRQARRLRLVNILQRQGLLLLLAILVIVMWRLSPYFLTTSDLLNIGSEVGALGIMAVAQTALIISGGFDISVGSALAMSGVTVGLLFEHGVNIWIACIVGLVVGALIGAVNGVIVVWLKINALITTLGTMSIFAGLAYILTSGSTLVVENSGFSFIGTGKLAGIPFPLLLFVVVFGFGLVIERLTHVGRAIYAIGGNREAARLSGIEVRAIPFALFTISGLSAGLAGIIVTSQLAASSPQVGPTYNLSVVTAVILGGASLAGGRGSVIGTLLAVLILGSLQDGFALLQLSSFVQTMALGAALIIAVLLDQVTRSLKGSWLGGG